MGGISSKISSKGVSPNYTYAEPLHEKPVFHYLMFLMVITTLVIGSVALFKISRIQSPLPTGNAVAETISIDDFLRKLTSHDEMKSYVGIAPLNLVQITSNNLPTLQSQISGLDVTYFGNFLVQYPDKIIIYDYATDKIRGSVAIPVQQQAQLSADVIEKLYKHQEMQGLQNQQPLGGQLDAKSLETLKQQFPDVYANAKAGDFLLRYQTKLIIYDYNQDKIVNAVNLK